MKSDLKLKGGTGGVYICEVFECFINPDFSSKLILNNITDVMRDRLGLKGSNGFIEIKHGSGTGYSIIKELIIEHTGIERNQIYSI